MELFVMAGDSEAVAEDALEQSLLAAGARVLWRTSFDAAQRAVTADAGSSRECFACACAECDGRGCGMTLLDYLDAPNGAVSQDLDPRPDWIAHLAAVAVAVQRAHDAGEGANWDALHEWIRGNTSGPAVVAEEEAPGVYALKSYHRLTRWSEPAVADAADIAAAAFAAALREHAGAAALDPEAAEALGRRAAEAVAGGLEWYEHVGEVVDVYRAQALLQVGSRQAVYDLVKRNRLLGLRRSGGAMAIPLFQLDPATGRPYRVMPAVLTTFTEAAVDAYTVASWFNTPQLELSGDTPATAMRDPARSDAVRRCAVAAAARWSR